MNWKAEKGRNVKKTSRRGTMKTCTIFLDNAITDLSNWKAEKRRNEKKTSRREKSNEYVYNNSRKHLT